MNATSKAGIWEETLDENTKLLFNTTRDPERITIQHKGSNPIHYDFDDGISEKEIERVRRSAIAAFNIEV